MSDPRAPSRHSFHKVTVPLIALTVTAMLLATGNQDWSHGHGRLATQSVSALPPTMPSAQAQPYSATKIRPSPGGSQLYQPSASGKVYTYPGNNTSVPASQHQPLGPTPNQSSAHVERFATSLARSRNILI